MPRRMYPGRKSNVPLNNRHSEKNARADAPCPLCGNPGHYAYTGRDLLYDHPGDYPYHACRHCRAVFIVPMPEPEVIGSFYPDDYMVYEKNKGPKRYGWAEKSVLHHRYRYRHLSPPPPARALAPLLAAFLYLIPCTTSRTAGGWILDAATAVSSPP